MAAVRATLPRGTPIEIWWQDEARVGQKNGITRRWARRGTRPSAPKDQRTRSAYIYGAICPDEGKAAGLVLPRCNTEGMTLHLAEIAATVAPGAHAVLLFDQAGWHGSDALVVPANITLMPLPSKCPELNRLCRKLLLKIGCGMTAAPHCGSRSMFKGRHFDRSVILLCVRWYLAYSLSLRDLEEMLTERGVSVDHSTIHRWVEHFSPRLLERFNRRKRAVTGKWHVDETYIKVRGRWMYQYRAIDSVGDTVEFWFSEHRDLPAAKRFLRKALARHGRPDRIVIDGSQTNREAIIACDTESRLRDRPRRPLKRIGIRQSQYLNNRIEQDHRRIKQRARPMLGFKSFGSAAITLAGIEMVQMMRKRQGRFAFNPAPTLKEQFEAIAA